MLRYRLTFGLFAAGVLLLTSASAWAFSQQSVGPGGDGNSTFTDPDEQLTGSGEQLSELAQKRPSVRLEWSGDAVRCSAAGYVDSVWWGQWLHYVGSGRLLSAAP